MKVTKYTAQIQLRSVVGGTPFLAAIHLLLSQLCSKIVMVLQTIA